jgi:hypothetical protein
MTIYSGLNSGQTAGQQAANAIWASTPLAMLDFGGGMSELILNATAPNSAHWRSFLPGLMQDVGQQGIGFSVLAQALPYVQSQEELGQLINTYKNYVQNTTGIQFDDNVNDPYRLDAIPGTGPTVHGTAVPGGAVDWGQQTQALQQLIDDYMGVLPGQRITELYGQPGGGLTGEAARRLWQQFPNIRLGAGDRNIPNIFTNVDAATGLPLSPLPFYQGADQPYRTLTPLDLVNAQHAGTISYTPSWDPATGQWVHAGGQAPPRPEDYFQQSDPWQQLTQSRFDASPQGQAAREWADYLNQVSQYFQNQPAAVGSQLQSALNAAPMIQGAPGQGASFELGAMPLSLQQLLAQSGGGVGLTPEQLQALQWTLSQGQPGMIG